jgi:hypothetical protein
VKLARTADASRGAARAALMIPREADMTELSCEVWGRHAPLRPHAIYAKRYSNVGIATAGGARYRDFL